MVKLKGYGITAESDLDKRAYEDIKELDLEEVESMTKKLTAKEKRVVTTATARQGSTNTEIAELTDTSPAYVERTMRKAQGAGVATKKKGKWYTDPKKLAILGIGAGLLALVVLTLATGVGIGATATMGDVQAGKTATPVQQSPFATTFGAGDFGAGKSIAYLPIGNSPFSNPMAVGDVAGEQPIVQQLSPFSPARSADISDVAAGEIASPRISQSGATFLGSSPEYGDIYQYGDQIMIVGDESNVIQQQMRTSRQGGSVALVNTDVVQQTNTYKDLSTEEKAWIEKYLN